MLNYYELVKLIGNNDHALYTIREDFKEDLANYLNKESYNKSTRAGAVKKYSNLAELRADKEHSYLYGTQTTILYSNNVNFTDKATGGKKADYTTIIKDVLKDMKRQDEYIDYCAGLARALGWSPAGCEKRFWIEFDGVKYNWSLVWSVFSMIADSKQNGGCDVFTSKCGNCQFLVLRSIYGIVAVCPFNNIANPVYKVNFKDFMEHGKELDNRIIEEAKKSA